MNLEFMGCLTVQILSYLDLLAPLCMQATIHGWFTLPPVTAVH